MMKKKKGYAKGGLKPAPNKGAASLPKAVRNKMGFMNKGGAMMKKKGYAAGGSASSYKNYKSVSAAQKAGSMYFMGKEGKKKLAVTKEQLDSWKKKNKGKYKGSALTAWANAKGKDIGGSSARDSSPRPKLRPGSESAGPMMGVMTKAEKAEVDAANEANQKAKDKMSGRSERESAGQKFNAWYKKNGSKYKTMKSAMEAYQSSLKSGNSKGGMAKKKKSGYTKGGMVDMRTTGLFR